MAVVENQKITDFNIYNKTATPYMHKRVLLDEDMRIVFVIVFWLMAYILPKLSLMTGLEK